MRTLDKAVLVIVAISVVLDAVYLATFLLAPYYGSQVQSFITGEVTQADIDNLQMALTLNEINTLLQPVVLIMSAIMIVAIVVSFVFKLKV